MEIFSCCWGYRLGACTLQWRAIARHRNVAGRRSGDTYLLEHNAATGRDKIWSNNNDGEGTNWLGLQLMVVRDRLSGKQEWTRYIGTLINIDGHGDPHTPAAGNDWHRDQADFWHDFGMIEYYSLTKCR